jgi:RHS repeat-associated protein
MPYSYDADGRVNLINRDGQTLTLGHDNYDRLTQANDTSYLYDGEGRRIRAVSGAGERRFLQASNGGLDVTELLTDASGNVISDYVYGNGSVPISRLDANGNPIYYLTDAMGSVIGEVDGDGNVVSRFIYDAFGNIRSQSGLSSAISGGDFRFQGQWLESDSGLYYFRARDYDAKTGLFLSRDAVDPIQVTPESANPYQFAYQNPLIYSDPSGMFTLSELNSSMTIQNILNQFERELANQTKDFLVKKARSAIGDVFASTLKTFLPISFIENGFEISTYEPGNRFEKYFLGITCGLLGKTFATITQGVYFEARVGVVSGQPYSDGYNCNLVGNDKGRRSLSRRGAFPSEKFSQPDFIFKNSPPTQEPPKELLIGDVKYSVKSLYDAYVDGGNPDQWNAITNYAKYSNGHEYAPITFFATFTGAKKSVGTWIKALEEKSIEAGVVTFILNLQGG